MLGHVKQYSQSKMRCFAGLNVVHRRVHVEHDHLMVLTHQIDGGEETGSLFASMRGGLASANGFPREMDSIYTTT